HCNCILLERCRSRPRDCWLVPKVTQMDTPAATLAWSKTALDRPRLAQGSGGPAGGRCRSPHRLRGCVRKSGIVRHRSDLARLGQELALVEEVRALQALLD